MAIAPEALTQGQSESADEMPLEIWQTVPQGHKVAPVEIGVIKVAPVEIGVIEEVVWNDNTIGRTTEFFARGDRIHKSQRLKSNPMP